MLDGNVEEVDVAVCCESSFDGADAAKVGACRVVVAYAMTLYDGWCFGVLPFLDVNDAPFAAVACFYVYVGVFLSVMGCCVLPLQWEALGLYS